MHTLKTDATTKEVLLAGEFEGEDLPLCDIELKYRGGLVNAILHPNSPRAAHKLEEGQVRLVLQVLMMLNGAVCGRVPGAHGLPPRLRSLRRPGA